MRFRAEESRHARRSALSATARSLADPLTVHGYLLARESLERNWACEREFPEVPEEVIEDEGWEVSGYGRYN